MTIERFDSPRGGAYTAPSAEEIQLLTSRQILEGSLTPDAIPPVEEQGLDWD